MIRTQIYLTDQQRSELVILSEAQGKKQSELIREAIDILIEQTSQKRRNKILYEAAGIWKNRSDIPDFKEIRSEWDRG
jgi:septum formation inhibitor-activating ATPase MinD